MYEIMTDPIGVQAFVERKFRPTNNFEIMDFFCLTLYFIQLYGTTSYVEVVI